MTFGRHTVHEGDNLDWLRTLPDASVHAVVTDPPYGLAFMGRRWDYDVPSEALWAEVLRVCKPGAHLLSFGGTRTYHRLVVRVEDAGWEVRDQIAWVYGTGFPKSHDVSKAIDRAAGAERQVLSSRFRASTGRGSQGSGGYAFGEHFHITAPATDDARRWEGWGTALKPAMEPIVVARKPLDGTVAANVLSHGTGALNVDGCRVETDGEAQTAGRWPANLIHDGSPEVEALFPVGVSSARPRHNRRHKSDAMSGDMGASITHGFSDSGSAARFFYCAKASKRERSGSRHPTVKPLALMRYLVRLITPPGGVVLDPFLGSGTTLLAAEAEGVTCWGAEREHGDDVRLRWAAR